MSVQGPGSVGGGDILGDLRSGRIKGDENRLRAASQLLEGVFYQQLFKAMRDTVPEGGLITGGQGQEIFEGLLDEQMAESAAMDSTGGMGEALFRHFAPQIGLAAPVESGVADPDPRRDP